MLRRIKAKLKKSKESDRGKLPLPPYQQDGRWDWARSGSTEYFDGFPYHGQTTSNTVDDEHLRLHARLKDDLDSQSRIADGLLADVGMIRSNVYSSIHIEPIDVAEEQRLLEKTNDSIKQYEDRQSMSIDHQDIRGDWPRRLLHVPTMTSLEWQPGNIFGVHAEPRYVALSYTWGRYRILDSDLAANVEASPSLPVSGIHWRIPPIKKSLFSAKQFENVLRRAAAHDQADFVWLDVACIDQTKNSKDGADEIGRQAKIFGRASKAFAWLLVPANDKATHDLSLRKILGELDKAAQAASRSKITVQEMESDIQWFMAAAAASNDLAEIPWWTSLWTLQEAFMRPDSILLDNEGHMVLDGSGNQPETLSNILKRVADMYHLVGTQGRAIRTEADQDIQYFLAKHGFIRVVDRSGLYALGRQNPLSLYTCAKGRETLNPLDRVYGIMQIWGFRLGKAALNAPATDNGRTLEDLEVELGIELICKFPIESQLFVHNSSIAKRQAWRVSNDSSVPAFVISLNFEKGRLSGKVDSGCAALGIRCAKGVIYGTFSGKAIPLQSFIEAAIEAKKLSNLADVISIALDENAVFNKWTLQSGCSTQEVPVGKHEEIMLLLSAKASVLQRRLMVGLLTVLTANREAERRLALGIILMEVADKQIGRWWKRIGICIWDVPTHSSLHDEADSKEVASVLDVGSDGWRTLEALFG